MNNFCILIGWCTPCQFTQLAYNEIVIEKQNGFSWRILNENYQNRKQFKSRNDSWILLWFEGLLSSLDLGVRTCQVQVLIYNFSPALSKAELAEHSPIIIQNSSNPLSWKNLDVRPYDCTTIQGATFNMRGQLYCRHNNATVLSSSLVVSVVGSKSDDQGSSPG